MSGQTTGFLYDGTQAIAELRGGSIDTVYHTGMAIDEVLAKYVPSGNKTLLTDALMSVIAQANDSQGVDNYYAYSPYGTSTTLGPDDGNPIQYTGRENDQTGIYYYRARYYDPVLKQWISDDPIGLAGGINQRAYVRGNPITFVDALGLDGQLSAGISGTLFGSISGGLFPSVGVSGGMSLGMSTDGSLSGTSFFWQSQANGLVGSGVFGGVGVAGGVSTTDGALASGTTVTPYVEVNAGLGKGTGVGVPINPEGTPAGLSGSFRFFPGTAIGAMAGGGVSTTTTRVSPTIGQMWDWLKCQFR